MMKTTQLFLLLYSTAATTIASAQVGSMQIGNQTFFNNGVTA